jgi:hypothetical protein
MIKSFLFIFFFPVLVAFAEEDPLDKFIIEEAGQDSSGRGFVEEHKQLEKELLERRKELGQGGFRVKFHVARKSDASDFDSLIEKNPSFSKSEIDPSRRVGNRLREEKKKEYTPLRALGLRAYLLQEAKLTRERLVPQRFSLAKFNPELPRNPSGTVSEASVSNAFSEEIEDESSILLQQVFRSKRYKEKVHPGASMIRP